VAPMRGDKKGISRHALTMAKGQQDKNTE